MKQDDRQDKRPEAYPKISETDQQLKRQDEYIDPQSATKDDQTSMSGDTGADKAIGRNEDSKDTSR